jgi:hypothetical protein
MGTNRYGKEEVVERVTKLIEGIDQFADLPLPIVARGQVFTPAEVKAKLQSIVDLRQRADDARAQLAEALAEEERAMPDLLAFASAVRAHVKLVHGTSPIALAAHGIHPKARASLTAEARAVAVAKRAATRTARHTMGPRQKEKIKGNVIGVEIQPVHDSGPPVDESE